MLILTCKCVWDVKENCYDEDCVLEENVCRNVTVEDRVTNVNVDESLSRSLLNDPKPIKMLYIGLNITVY